MAKSLKHFDSMNFNTFNQRRSGFTLMETVISIGLLAVLLSAFLVAFTPAAQGIRKSISIAEVDRLASALQIHLVTVRPDETNIYTSGFDKAYQLIEQNLAANPSSSDMLLVYQYRADLNPSSGNTRTDGTRSAYTRAGGVPGEDYIVQSMMRQASDDLLEEDLLALVGKIYTVKMQQLAFPAGGGQLQPSSGNGIIDPTPYDGDPPFNGSDSYPEAVIAFAAEFYVLPNASYDYVQNNLNANNLREPVFTRNLTVSR